MSADCKAAFQIGKKCKLMCALAFDMQQECLKVARCKCVANKCAFFDVFKCAYCNGKQFLERKIFNALFLSIWSNLDNGTELK